MRKILGILFCAIFIGSAIAIISPTTVDSSESQVNSPLYTTHDPIYIDGNSNFISANGVSNPSAAGTEANPYLIEDWNISASFTNGIEIRNTNAYFIIRNCYVHDCNYFEFDFNNGIYFHNVTNGRVETTNSSKNLCGIFLYSSNNCTISNNRASNNTHGILLSHSNNNILSNNTFENNGIVINGNTVEHFNTHNIDTNNIANEKPIYYYKNQNDINIDGWSTGQVILANCTNFTVNNVDCSNASVGVQLAYCNNCSIENSTFNNETCGNSLCFSSYNNIYNNNASNNFYGIQLSHSNDNIISNNSVNSNNDYGICLESSSYNNIFINSVNSNNGNGIGLLVSSDNIVINNSVNSNNNFGIFLWRSTSNNIYNNNASNNNHGICTGHSVNNTISNNNLNSNNWNGISLDHSSYNNISNNSANSNNHYGIHLEYSSYNNISNNNASNNSRYGFYLEYSSYNILINNTLENDGIYIWGLGIEYFNTHSMDTTNTANSKPVYYYKNQKDINIDGWSVGQVILANCTNFTVNNVDCSNASVGIQLAYCNNCSVENSVFSNGWYGIRLDSSNYNNIFNNSANSNNWDGIYLFSSSYNNVFKNRVNSSNGCGIWLDFSSSNNLLSNNNVSNNWFGIYLGSSLGSSNNNSVYNNSIDSNNYRGVYLSHSSNSTFVSNNISYNHCSVEIYSSSCKNNIFHHNNFISGSAVNITDNGVNTEWDDGYDEGNYWSDYTGLDDGSNGRVAGDGVGDTNIPHTELDNYPLMDPVGRISVPPIISSISVSDVTANSATISWVTDENSDSRVNYSVNSDLSSNSIQYNSTLTTTHSITLTGLNPETTYYFEVSSTDTYGTTATDDNNSHHYTFTTEIEVPAQGEPFSILNYWWTILLVIVIAAITVIIAMSRRKKGKASAQQSDVSQTSETTQGQPSESEDTTGEIPPS